MLTLARHPSLLTIGGYTTPDLDVKEYDKPYLLNDELVEVTQIRGVDMRSNPFRYYYYFDIHKGNEIQHKDNYEDKQAIIDQFSGNKNILMNTKRCEIDVNYFPYMKIHYRIFMILKNIELIQEIKDFMKSKNICYSDIIDIKQELAKDKSYELCKKYNKLDQLEKFNIKTIIYKNSTEYSAVILFYGNEINNSYIFDTEIKLSKIMKDVDLDNLRQDVKMFINKQFN